VESNMLYVIFIDFVHFVRKSSFPLKF
jgi:hypothetical protein